jgi:hypothetical protein
MQQHELDPVSLVAGLAFSLIAGAYFLSQAGGVQLHWLIAVPAGLILVGVGVLAVVVRRMRRVGLREADD